MQDAKPSERLRHFDPAANSEFNIRFQATAASDFTLAAVD